MELSREGQMKKPSFDSIKKRALSNLRHLFKRATTGNSFIARAESGFEYVSSIQAYRVAGLLTRDEWREWANKSPRQVAK